jgi:hypothetical protein
VELAAQYVEHAQRNTAGVAVVVPRNGDAR